MNTIRRPAVAGTFYPSNPRKLAADIDALLGAQAAEQREPPKALIVPHAGYIYSGPTAAIAYARLRPLRGQVTRVVLLGPVHRVPIKGLALPSVAAFETPLGMVPIDQESVEALCDARLVSVDAEAHALEHSLEVQLPFLQMVLDRFTLVPLAVGDATGDEVADVIELMWGGPETLIVVSSDLSHYLPYAQAVQYDRATADAVLDLREPLDHEQACGATPVNGLIVAARRRGLRPTLLDLRNSGDTAGDRHRVVGYGAFAFAPA